MNSCYYYSRYYLGHEFEIETADGSKFRDGIASICDCGGVFGFNDVDYIPDIKGTENDEFRLVLIHPDDMTAEQKKEYYKLTRKIYNKPNKTIIVDTPFSLEYLLHHGIDAFNLIENGYAIDKNKPK